MARLKKSFTSKSISNQGTSQSAQPTNLSGQPQTTIRSTAKLNAVTDLRRFSNGDLPLLNGIQFGSPSNTGVKSSSSPGAGSEWTSLMKTASSGAASLIGGGFLESGIGSLLSGLTSLFGDAGKSEAPLTRFVLPDSQQQTMYISSGGLSANTNSGVAPQNTLSQGPVYRQSDITQAVKNALLTSSSLNDVIAEI